MADASPGSVVVRIANSRVIDGPAQTQLADFVQVRGAAAQVRRYCVHVVSHSDTSWRLESNLTTGLAVLVMLGSSIRELGIYSRFTGLWLFPKESILS